MKSTVLAIDLGTSSARAMAFRADGSCIASAQHGLGTFYPQAGWVEQSPQEIWQATLHVCQQAITEAQAQGYTIKGIGITNQRETVILWDKNTGESLGPAIVWQDRRTAQWCAQQAKAAQAIGLTEKTGLILDAYFSASKISWMLSDLAPLTIEDICVGTVDTYLCWKLTSGAVHATDATNAARTLLYDIHQQHYDSALCRFFKIPKEILPVVKNNVDDFGQTDPKWFGKSIPILAMIGDQQSAAIGQACIEAGQAKCTFGTGSFLLLNTGTKPLSAPKGLLTTIASTLPGGQQFAIEGANFNAGSVIQWLKSELGLIDSAEQTEALAASVPNSNGCCFVPAFTGLGAPFWVPEAKASIVGLCRDTNKAHIIRAALEGIAFQTKALLEPISQIQPIKTLHIDGGMSANNWFAQLLADTLQMPIERSCYTESTAVGAAFLASVGCGWFSQLNDINKIFKRDRLFEPKDIKEIDKSYRRWQQAVELVIQGATL